MAVRVSTVVSFHDALLAALIETDPTAKCAQVAALVLDNGIGGASSSVKDARIPGRPSRPQLVRPRDLPARGLGTVEGRAGLCHAVAHIEFNAINLALDACWRFAGMPEGYYADWLSVAKDEARHFLMMRVRLQELGFDYGDFDAHNSLWDAAEKTCDDVLVRMACVPRVLEARGLDVTPQIIRRLRSVHDAETVAVLEVILAEEVGHVAIGTRWFRHCCAERGLEPVVTFRRLLAEQGITLRPPFNLEARALAGFLPDELAA